MIATMSGASRASGLLVPSPHALCCHLRHPRGHRHRPQAPATCTLTNSSQVTPSSQAPPSETLAATQPPTSAAWSRLLLGPIQLGGDWTRISRFG